MSRCLLLQRERGDLLREQVKLKASKLQALCAQHGLETDVRQLIVQQHHPRAAPRWLRVNEVSSVWRDCWRANVMQKTCQLRP